MNMKDTGFCPAEKIHGRIAATQVIGGSPLIGRVHDPLASLQGGISGNAGLFSTGEDLSKFCRMLLNEGKYGKKEILSEESAYLLTHEVMYGRAYGFDVSSEYSWIKGEHSGPTAYGHSGYTGTSVVISPDQDLFLIILTNRAHPDDKGTVKRARGETANIVFGPEPEIKTEETPPVPAEEKSAE